MKFLFSFFRMLLIFTTFIVFILILFSFEQNIKICDLSNIDFKYKNKNIYNSFVEKNVREKLIIVCNNKHLQQDINTSLLEDLILEDQNIKKAELYLDVSGKLEVILEFKTPFARQLKNQELIYLDSELNILSDVIQFDKKLIVLSGDVETSDNNLIKLIESVYNNKILNSLIGGINYDVEGGYVLSSNYCNLFIDIGFQSLSDEIIKRIETFLLFQEEFEYCDYCDTINLKYNNQVICVK